MVKTNNPAASPRQDALLLTVTRVAQKLLTHTTSQSFDEVVMDCLSMLGEALNQNRLYIWKDFVDAQGVVSCIQIYEWVKGIHAIQGNEQFENIPYDNLPSFRDALDKGQCLNQRVCELSESEKNILEPQAIQTLLVAPIIIDGKRWGFIGVDNCRSSELFSEHEQSMLLTSGFMLASAILKEATENHVRQSEEIVQAMFDASPLGCSVWNKNLVLIDCNEGMVKLFELDSKQAFLSNFEKLSPKFQPCGQTSSALSTARILEAFRTGRVEFEWVHQKLDGQPIPVHVSLVRIRYKHEEAVTAYVRDLRELKAQEEQRREAEARTQLMLNAMPLCCNFWDKNFVNTACNDEAVRLFQLKSQQEYLDRFMDLSPERQPCGGLSAELAQEKIVQAFTIGHVRFEWMHCRLDGTLIPAEITLIRLMFKNEYFVVGYTRDLRDHKSMLAKVNAAQRKLAEARDEALAHSKAKSDFLANMSHEIRTPMNGILGLSYLALQLPDISPQVREYISKIDNSAKALLRVINDILDFSKISAGKLDIEHSPFDLMGVLEMAIQPIIPSIMEKGLEILFDFSVDIPETLVGDAVRLRQVVLNLLTNAAKFTHQGTILISIHIEVQTDTEVTLRFTVSDTGVGIEQGYIDQLFEPFTQADTSVTRRYGGTGLGLAICKQIINLMGGKLSVTSTVGAGSAFSFTAVFGVPENTGKGPRFQSCLEGRQILVGGGSETYHAILKKCLLRFGAAVTCEDDTRKALERLTVPPQEGPWYAAVLDWTMPPEEAQATTDRLQRLKTENSPLIIAATYDHALVHDRSATAGIDAVLIKPVTPSALHTAFLDAARARGYEVEHPDNTEALPEPASGAAQNRPLPLAGKRALLAEDNEINRIIAVELLSSFGMSVAVATTGREAIEIALSEPFDVILMDIQMPETDGIEATRQLRGKHRNLDSTPIIAMTAHAMADDHEKSLKAGMQAHITKPIDPHILLTSLLEWIK